jgi:ABC-type dipeptide/oligopeptide/nickel transport system permease subunit
MAREAAVPLELEEEVRIERPPLRRRLLNLVRQHPLGLFGLLTVVLFFFVGTFAEVDMLGVRFGVAPYDAQAIHRAPQTVARLSSPIDAEQTRLPISYDGKLNLGPGGPFTIADETMYVMMIEPDALTVVRASGATEAVPHEAGASLEIVTQVFEGPSLSHPFGTDGLGRDVLSRTIFGARISLMIGMVSIIIGVSVGAGLGIVSGFLGGLVDSLIQRSVDILLAFPAIVTLLALVTVVGDETSAFRRFLAEDTPVPEGSFLGVPFFLDIFILSLAIAVAVAVGTARVIRGTVLSIKENVYIDAARALGASDARIMWHHVLPNVVALVVVVASISLPLAILAEAAISFLGVGVPAPTPSWGADITGPNQEEALAGNWWPVFFPGLALSLVVLGFNLLGDAFRDISDPRLRGAGGSGGASRGP